MSGDEIAFEVRGAPVPEGSTRTWMVKGKPVTTHAGKGLGAWRRVIADVAQRHAPPELWDGPVGIRLLFTLQPPKSEPKRRRTWPDRRPDLDKLERAVLDALTGVIFRDDGQVVHVDAAKDWGAPGVTVQVYRIEGPLSLAQVLARYTIRKLVWEGR